MQTSRLQLIDTASTLRDISRELRTRGYAYQAHSSTEEFLINGKSSSAVCVLVDIACLRASKHGLSYQVKRLGSFSQIIVVADHVSVSVAVEIMEQGAATVLVRPFDFARLAQAIERALRRSEQPEPASKSQLEFKQRWETLTEQEREIVEFMLSGKKNKAIASSLNLSTRTIDRRRQSIFKKMNACTLSELGLLYGQFRTGD